MKKTALAATLFILTACGSPPATVASSAPLTPAASTAVTTIQAPPEEETSPTPSELPGHYSGTLAFENQDGYTFEVEYEFAATLSSDPSQQKPGRTLIIANPSGRFTIRNTTTARQTRIESLGINFSYLYPRTSPWCQRENSDQKGSKGCAVNVSFGLSEGFDTLDLSPDEAQSFDLDGRMMPIGVFDEEIAPTLESISIPSGGALAWYTELPDWNSRAYKADEKTPCYLEVRMGGIYNDLHFSATDQTPNPCRLIKG